MDTLSLMDLRIMILAHSKYVKYANYRYWVNVGYANALLRDAVDKIKDNEFLVSNYHSLIDFFDGMTSIELNQNRVINCSMFKDIDEKVAFYRCLLKTKGEIPFDITGRYDDSLYCLVNTRDLVDVYGNRLDKYNLNGYSTFCAYYPKATFKRLIDNHNIEILNDDILFVTDLSVSAVYKKLSDSGYAVMFVYKENDTTIHECDWCHCPFPVFSNTDFNSRYCPHCSLNVGHSTCVDCGYEFLGLSNSMSYCPHCEENHKKYRIKSYHDTPQMRYFDYDERSGNNFENHELSRYTFKGYGVELEVGRAGQRDENSEETIKALKEEVYTMRDGSINRDGCLGGDDYDYGGFEIITFPHTEKALYNMNWEGAFKYLLKKGYRSHDIKTCGLHIHISRTLLNSTAIINMMYFYEKWWNDIIKFSRRQSREANKWAGRYVDNHNCSSDDELYQILEREYADYNGNGEHDMRYKAVNIQNCNTVEIRIMRGTLKLSTFLATLDFMITIAKNANTITDRNDLKQWLSGMKTETYEYMRERGCFGYKGKVDESKELEENIAEEE